MKSGLSVYGVPVCRLAGGAGNKEGEMGRSQVKFLGNEMMKQVRAEYGYCLFLRQACAVHFIIVLLR